MSPLALSRSQVRGYTALLLIHLLKLAPAWWFPGKIPDIFRFHLPQLAVCNLILICDLKHISGLLRLKRLTFET